MEYVMTIFGILLYFLIGGFVNGLMDIDMGPMVVFWPVALIALGFLWLSDRAEDLGYNVREFFQNRKRWR